MPPTSATYDFRMSRERVTVTLDAETAADLRQQAEQGRIPSISAFVEAAIEEKRDRERTARAAVHDALAVKRARDPEQADRDAAWAANLIADLREPAAS